MLGGVVWIAGECHCPNEDEGMHLNAGGRRGRELFSGVGRNVGVMWDGMSSEGVGEG
jgi:hypothetical protein